MCRVTVLSLLLQSVRRGDLTEDLALQHHDRLTELKMRLLGDRMSRHTAWKIALAAKAKDVVPLAPLETRAIGHD